MIKSYGLKFSVVMTEVDDHFGDAGFQVLHSMDIEIAPFTRANRRIGHDYGIQNDVLLGKAGEKVSGQIGKPKCQKRQIVFMSDPDVDGEKFRLRKKHAQVAVQVSGMNSESDSAFDLGAN